MKNPDPEENRLRESARKDRVPVAFHVHNMPISGLSFVERFTESAEGGVSVASFYSQILGLTMTARFEEFAFFDAGGVALALSGDLARRSPSPSEACEFVFGVASVAAAYKTLRDRIAFVNQPRQVNGENWAVSFHDPAGHLLSFYGPQ